MNAETQEKRRALVRPSLWCREAAHLYFVSVRRFPGVTAVARRTNVAAGRLDNVCLIQPFIGRHLVKGMAKEGAESRNGENSPSA